MNIDLSLVSQKASRGGHFPTKSEAQRNTTNIEKQRNAFLVYLCNKINWVVHLRHLGGTEGTERLLAASVHTAQQDNQNYGLREVE